MAYLLDINVWLAMAWGKHTHHLEASLWETSRGSSTLLFCRLSMLGFMRLITDARVMGDYVLNLGSALSNYNRLMDDPTIELMPEPRGLDILLQEALMPFATNPATKAVTDCYFVAFAESVGATLVTFDKGLAAIARHRKVPVTLIHPKPKL